MQDGMVLVFTRPTPGNAGRFNRWYDEVHLGEMLQLDGFVNGIRYAVTMTNDESDTATLKYLAIYGVELSRARKSIEERPTFNMSDALDDYRVVYWFGLDRPNTASEPMEKGSRLAVLFEKPSDLERQFGPVDLSTGFLESSLFRAGMQLERSAAPTGVSPPPLSHLHLYSVPDPGSIQESGAFTGPVSSEAEPEVSCLYWLMTPIGGEDGL